jgi:hypothetical protein
MGFPYEAHHLRVSGQREADFWARGQPARSGQPAPPLQRAGFYGVHL